MVKTKQEIITDIKTYITGNGGDFSEWYVGVCNDVNKRLSAVHKLNPKLDKWVFRTAPTSAIAKEIEYYFVKILGADGASAGSSDLNDKVYAYKKPERTEP
jgi:hypothetical protein